MGYLSIATKSILMLTVLMIVTQPSLSKSRTSKGASRNPQYAPVCSIIHPSPLVEGRGVEIAWVHVGDSWYTSLFIVGMFALRFACFFLIHLVKILISFSTISLASQTIIWVFWHTWCVMDYSGAFAHAKHVQQSTLSLAKSIYVMILIGRNSARWSCEILFCLLSIFCAQLFSQSTQLFAVLYTTPPVFALYQFSPV